MIMRRRHVETETIDPITLCVLTGLSLEWLLPLSMECWSKSTMGTTCPHPFLNWDTDSMTVKYGKLKTMVTWHANIISCHAQRFNTTCVRM